MLKEFVSNHRIPQSIISDRDKLFTFLLVNETTEIKARKLDHVQIAPFEVEQQTSNVNYRWKLPEKAQIHQNFHVSLLELAPTNAQVKTK